MKKLLTIFSILLLSNCAHYVIKAKPSKTLLIAHKGSWRDGTFPANSIKAFDEALREGFDGFELDVILTSDNQFIVMHDEKLKHSTNCKGNVGDVKAKDLDKCALKKNIILPVSTLVIKKTKNRDQIATLKEVFEKYLPQENLKKIVVDVKPIDDQKIVQALRQALSPEMHKQYGQKLIFIGKSAEITQEIKRNFPKSFTALEGAWGSEPVVDYKKYLDHTTHDFVSLNAELMFGHLKSKQYFSNIENKNRKYLDHYLAAAKAANMPTIAWTINSKKNYQYLLSKEVEVILTDRSLQITDNSTAK